MPACRLMLSLFTAATFSFIVGCTPTAPKVTAAPAPTPATPEQAQSVQAAISTSIPGSVVGHVSGINGTLVAVSFPAPFPKLFKGDSIQFRDSQFTGIANGQVVSIDATNPDYPLVVVDFEKLDTGRAPAVGDMAVFVPSTH